MKITIGEEYPDDIGPIECCLCMNEYNARWTAKVEGFPKSSLDVCEKCKNELQKSD